MVAGALARRSGWRALIARAVASVALVLASACGSSGGDVLVDEAAEPAAMVALPEGGLLFGERLTGAIRRVTADGELVPEPVAIVPVQTDGEQRGLLGLAVDGAGRLFISWADVSGRLMVGRLDGSDVLPIWRGPPTASRANGGRIAFGPEGGLLIGVGIAGDPEAAADPHAPNGKLLLLDPDGAPGQDPRVVSGGWNNPFAFAVAPSGAIWVADNAPGEGAERLQRGDLDPPGPAATLPPHTAPSGVAVISERELVVCGYGSGDLQRYRVSLDGVPRPTGAPVAGDCALGVVLLSDDRLAYATTDLIVEVTL